MIGVAVVLGLVAALWLRLVQRRNARRQLYSPQGGIPGEFFSPYRNPGRRSRSGKGF